MNSRPGFTPIRYLTGKNKGFSMAMSLGVGTSFLLMGMAMVVKTQNGQTLPGKVMRAEAMSAAEFGAVELQSFLERNRWLAKFSSACGEGGTQCWAQLLEESQGSISDEGSIQYALAKQAEDNLAAQCGDYSRETNVQSEKEQILAEVRQYAGGTWSPVDEGAPEQGEYRLVKYESYQENDKSYGKITIEGRGEKRQYTTRVAVVVRIDEAPPYQDQDYAPGLWLLDPESGGTGSPGINADVYVNNACGKQNLTFSEYEGTNLPGELKAGENNINVSRGHHVRYFTPDESIKLPRERGEIESILGLLAEDNKFVNIAPDGSEHVGVRLEIGGEDEGNNQGEGGGAGTSTTACIPDDTHSLPRSSHEANAGGEYEYAVSSVKLSGKDTISIQAGCKVTLHVLGDIKMSSQAGIEHQPSNPSDFANLQIFGYGGDNSISLSGNGKLYAFVLAPNYVGGVSDSSQGSSASLHGSLWIASWSGSNRNQAVIEQTATWDGIPPQFRPKSSKLGQIALVSLSEAPNSD